jgi:hypothetical protein
MECVLYAGASYTPQNSRKFSSVKVYSIRLRSLVRSCKLSHIFLLIRLFVMYEFPEKSMYFLFNKRMIKYTKIIFF